jgi:hypothetical protein
VEQKLKIRKNNKELMEIDNDKSPPVVMNMTDCAGLQYDWRLRLSRLNMTDFDLAKYDWRRRECGGGSGDYMHIIQLISVHRPIYSQKFLWAVAYRRYRLHLINKHSDRDSIGKRLIRLLGYNVD